MQPPLPVPSLPLWQPSPSGQEGPAVDGGSGHHGQVLFEREVKNVYFSHVLLNKEPSLVTGQSLQLLAGTGTLQNPEDSGVNAEIPVPQEFLQKNPVKTKKKQEFL